MTQILIGLIFIANSFGMRMVDPKPEVTILAEAD